MDDTSDPMLPEQPAEEEENAQDYSTAQEAAEILSQYWALEKDGAKLWQTLRDKEQLFMEAAERRGMFVMSRVAFSHYYGLSGAAGQTSSWQSQSMSFAGEDGELIEMSLNEVRSFWDQIFNMMTKNRPAFQAQATNTDSRTLSQVEGSDTAVKYFYEQVFGEKKEKEVVKLEGMYGKAYTHVNWDPDGGEDIPVETTIDSEYGPIPGPQQTEKSGEFLIQRMFWWDVVCEPFRSEYDGHLWRMLILPKRHKHELMARYPLWARAIDQSDPQDTEYQWRVPGADPGQRFPEDMCSFRIFYHERTPACPKGRRVVFVNAIMVDDGELPVDEIPVYPLMSCELHGTCFGISDLWNLIPAEQLQNQILSDVATNVEAFGRPPLVLVEGTDVDLDALANGQKVLFIPPNTERPEPVKFPAVPDVSFKVLELMRHFKQSLSGLNAISRGDTSTNVTSGAHAALYSQIAVESQSPRQAELDLHRERIANAMLMFLQRYAKHPQMVSICGEDERAYLEEFRPEDWNGIRRIVMKTANPALKTQAGRFQIAEMLRDWPGQPLKDPAQIIELITSGQFKPAYNTNRVMELAVRRENEALLKGPAIAQIPGPPDPLTGLPGAPQSVVQDVRVIATDNAATHLMGHLEVVYSPAAKKNPAVLQAALTHILEHLSVARMGDPYLAQLLGNPPPQQAMDPNAPPPNGKGADGSGPDKTDVNQGTKPLEDNQDDSKGAGLPKPATSPMPAQN